MQKIIYSDAISSEVIITRRRGSKNIRLSIKSDGFIKLNLPYGIPLMYAKKFINDKSEWINKHKTPIIILRNGDHVGKSHRIVISYSDIYKPKTRVTTNEIRINLPTNTLIETPEVQSLIRSTSERAIQKQATILLPQRLKTLSKKYELPYNNFKIRRLKSRWGSCDNYKNITLNNYLIQLDWRLIDYVITHELVHTIHQNHQQQFWKLMGQLMPDFKTRRKLIKAQNTHIIQTTF